jgi:hypothetical protein
VKNKKKPLIRRSIPIKDINYFNPQQQHEIGLQKKIRRKFFMTNLDNLKKIMISFLYM